MIHARGTLLFVAFLLAPLSVGTTQTPSASPAPPTFGVHVGLASTTFAGSDAQGFSSKVGLVIGASAAWKLQGRWTFQPELQYVMKGAQESDDDNGSTVNVHLGLNYLEVPLLFRLSGDKTSGGVTPFAVFGPTLAFKTACNASGHEGGINVSGSCASFGDGSDDFASVDYGVMIGGGVDFMFAGQKLMAVARYDMGLHDLSSRSNAQNRALEILLGIRL